MWLAELQAVKHSIHFAGVGKVSINYLAQVHIRDASHRHFADACRRLQSTLQMPNWSKWCLSDCPAAEQARKWLTSWHLDAGVL